MKFRVFTLVLFGLILALTLGFQSADAQEDAKAGNVADELAKLKKLQSDLIAQQDKLLTLQKPAVKPAAKRLASQPGGPDPKFKTGARRTPFSKIVEAMTSGRLGVHRARTNVPVSVTMVPPKLSMLGNDQYGDCVTAESCFSMEAYSVYVGLPEIIITDATAIAWASAHGVLNGADLLSVIQGMQTDGIKASDGKLYKAGNPSTVDFSNETTLQSAISVGPISIGIDSTALPSGAGNASGWFSFGGSPGQFSNEDHDVDICGYGDAKTLFAALNTPVPSGVPSGTLYLVYTWSTIGVVDHAWIMSTVGEAYVRTPTVVGLTPPTPPPAPTLVTVAVADVTAVVGQPTMFLPIASGGTGPYKFGFDYGDGAKDGTGTHTYSATGTYTVNVTVADSGGLFGSTTCKAVVGSTPTPPPIPTNAPTITLKGLSPDADGDYYLMKSALGNMRLIDLLTQQAPTRPVLTPSQRDALQQILNQMSNKK